MAKKELAPTVALAPVPAVLVSCGVVPEEYNIMAASWCGTCCSRPPMAYVSLRPATLSHRGICHQPSHTGPAGIGGLVRHGIGP